MKDKIELDLKLFRPELSARFPLWVLILGICSFLALLYFADKILDRFPNSADEVVYNLQADAFAEGRLSFDAHPLHENLYPTHIINDSQQIYGKYPPFWSALLALADKAALPRWMLNPLLGTLLVIVTCLLARRLYGPDVGLLSGLALLASSYFLLNSASFFSHTSSAVLVMLAAYCALRSFEGGFSGWIFLSGIFVGLSVMTRHFTGALCFFPLLLDRRFYRFKSAFYFLLGGMHIAVLFFAYNKLMTNDFLFMPFHFYHESGMKSHNYLEFLRFSLDSYSLASGFAGIPDRLILLAKYTNPVLLLFFCLNFIRSLLKLDFSFIDFYFPVLFAGHMFVGNYAGHEYGPRYFFTGWPFLVISAVSLLPRLKRFRKPAMLLFLLSFVFPLFMAGRYARFYNRIIWERQDLFRKVEDQRLSHALVLVVEKTGFHQPMYQKDLLRNDGRLENSVLYAVVYEDGDIDKLRHYFPDRPFYVYGRHDYSELEGKLFRWSEPANAKSDDGVIPEINFPNLREFEQSEASQ